MGSIIAPLCAVGYSPKEIESLMEQQDWSALFGDAVPQRFFTSDGHVARISTIAFSFAKGRPSLLGGLVAGQWIWQLLARVSWPVLTTGRP